MTSARDVAAQAIDKEHPPMTWLAIGGIAALIALAAILLITSDPNR